MSALMDAFFHLPTQPNPAQRVVWLMAAMSAPGGIRICEAQDELGICERTLRRYLQTIRSMGLLVIESGDSKHKTLRLRRGKLVLGR